jgi:hypothetical protein
MAVEVVTTDISDRQVVPITWDLAVVTGQLAKLYCVNPENGDKSESGISANDGSTEITVYDELGNADFGLIVVGEEEITTDPDAKPEHPIVLPPETDLKPEHPIVLPPEGSGGEHPDQGLPAPEGEVDPDYGVDEGTGPLRPTHPIVLPDNPVDPDYGVDEGAHPDHELPPVVNFPGYNPPPGANHPTPA